MQRCIRVIHRPFPHFAVFVEKIWLAAGRKEAGFRRGRLVRFD